MSTAMHTVHIRVNDSETGKPTPVRMRLTDSEGRYYPPFGRLQEFGTRPFEDVGGNLQLGIARYAYIDGACEVALPPDPITAEIIKGPEYVPIQREVRLGPGKMALRFDIERWTNSQHDGWFSGDLRAHGLSPHAALLEGSAEDLAIVNLLAALENTGSTPSIPNILAFSGQAPALESPGHLVVVNTHNRHEVLGSLALLNCHRIVYPLAFGGKLGPDNWTLADWCDQCHRKGGLVVWTEAALSGEDNRPCSEALADLLLGKVDAFEVTDLQPSGRGLADWYMLLNAGLRVPLVAASAKRSNATALGRVRTFARMDPSSPLTYKAWIEALRSGATFVSNGILLDFHANGNRPGAISEPSPDARTVHVVAEARSQVAIDCLEIVADGKVVAKALPGDNRLRVRIECDVPVSGSGWMAARCYGSVASHWSPQPTAAHTSAVYLQIAGSTSKRDPESLARLSKILSNTLDWAQQAAQLEDDRQRLNLTRIVQTAQQKLAFAANA